MRSNKDMKILFQKAAADTNRRMDKFILKDIVQTYNKTVDNKLACYQPVIWRTIMRSPVTKLTAAAVIIITAVFLVTFFEKAAAPAYALDQTIKANNTVKTVYLRKFERGQSIEKNEFSDYWLKYDNDGNLSNLRCNEHTKDGVMFTVWNHGIKKTWKPEKNVVIIRRLDNSAKREWDEFLKEFDYELFLQLINDHVKEEDGIELKIDEPAKDTDFIYVKATHLPSESRLELVVDRKTKLMKKMSEYRLTEQGDKLGERIEFFAYNQPIPPSVFELKEIPDNAKIFDRMEGGTIVPGKRVGGFTIGMSKDELLSRFGEPEHLKFKEKGYTLDNPPAQYAMRFGGVLVEIVNGKVNGFVVQSPNYKFADGLGVGDSVKKIRQTFGKETFLQEFDHKDMLYYEDKALIFEIDKSDNTLMEINVSPIESSSYIPETSYINEHGLLIDKVDYPFANDPNVLGGWKSVDYVRYINDFNPAKMPPKDKFFLNHLIFEEGGKIARSKLLTWTKGLVLSDEAASKYIIKKIDGTTYMFYQWKTSDYTTHRLRPYYYVLRKVPVEGLKYQPMVGEKADIPATSYINEQGRIVDKIDYPFVNDSQVIGTWKTVDFVRNIEDFRDPETQWQHGEDRPYLKQLVFLPDGKTTDNQRTWTRGLILHSGKKTAGEYTIKKIDGSTFLFFEWKNDSYSIRYIKPKYYVLKKVSQ
jgi:hypothetical protein